MKMKLPAGRYLAEMRYSASGSEQLMCGVRMGSRTLFRYHGKSSLLAGSYRDWVFDVHREGEVEFFFSFPGRREPSLRVEGGHLRRLSGFAPNAKDAVLLP
jgi:hypothetical protein